MKPEALDRFEKGRGKVRDDRLARIADVLGVHAIDLRACADSFADCVDRLRHIPDDE